MRATSKQTLRNAKVINLVIDGSSNPLVITFEKDNALSTGLAISDWITTLASLEAVGNSRGNDDRSGILERQ